MKEYLLGLDYGTGGAKACIINADGAVLGYAFEEYLFIHEKPGWSEHDPHGYWEAACRLVHRSLADAAIAATEIRALVVSSALPSLVMVDEKHEPVHRAYNLLDRRATAEVEWLKDHIGEERIKNLTGNRIEDHPTIVNLLWEKRHRPEAFKRIRWALTIDGYVTLKLTGKAGLTYPAASLYGVAYDLLNERFDAAILEEIDIDPAILPPLGRCEDIIGEVMPDAARATGLSAGTMVLTGNVDFNAGCIAAGVVDEGDIMSNLGTVGNFGVIHRSRDFNFSPVGSTMINLAFTIDSANTYVTIPSTTTGGQSIRYLRDTFSQAEIAAERSTGVSSYDMLNLQAAKVPVGSDGLVILPYLMGERTPIWDTAARGVVFGLSLNHTKGHVVRAMMEAVAYALYDSYRLIKQSGLKLNFPIVLNEGGAVSSLWRQIITDVFEVPTVLLKQRAGAPYGDAVLAGVASGVFPDFGVAKQRAEYIDLMEPNPINHARYMEYFELYRSLYQHVKEDFRSLARIRGGA